VVESIKTGIPKGYEHAEDKRPKSDAETRCEQLTVSLTLATEENANLQARIKELELMLLNVTETQNPRSKQALTSALLIDNLINGSGSE
jgi:hypothetical protein